MHSNRDDHKALCPNCGREYPPERQTCPEDGTTLFSYDSSDTDDSDPLIGRTFDERFHIEEVLGSGGMARVYRGVQLNIERDVAIKVLHPNLAENETFIKRFLREARVISGFNHPNIVRLIDFGQEPDHRVLYLVMEMIEGLHLDDLLSEGCLGPSLATEIVVQICSALSEAHAADVVHRDLKPTNIMLIPMADGRFQVKIIDFGIADALQHSTQLTQTGAICGTPRYMAPEQVLTEEVDPRADIYSLGALLFEMLSGRPVFQADRDVAMALRHARDSAPSLAECVSPDAVPEPLVALTDDMLIKDRDARPQSIIEVRNRLVEMRHDAIVEPIYLDPDDSLESAFGAWIRSEVPDPTAPDSSGFTERRETGSSDEMPETGEQGLDPEAILADERDADGTPIETVIPTPDYGERGGEPEAPDRVGGEERSDADATVEAGRDTGAFSGPTSDQGQENVDVAEQLEATMEMSSDYALDLHGGDELSETSETSEETPPSHLFDETPDLDEGLDDDTDTERSTPEQTDEDVDAPAAADPFLSDGEELDPEAPTDEGELTFLEEEGDEASSLDPLAPSSTPDDEPGRDGSTPASSEVPDPLEPVEDDEPSVESGGAERGGPSKGVEGTHVSEGELEEELDGDFEGEAPTEVWDSTPDAASGGRSFVSEQESSLPSPSEVDESSEEVEHHRDAPSEGAEGAHVSEGELGAVDESFEGGEPTEVWDSDADAPPGAESPASDGVASPSSNGLESDDTPAAPPTKPRDIPDIETPDSSTNEFRNDSDVETNERSSNEPLDGPDAGPPDPSSLEPDTPATDEPDLPTPSVSDEVDLSPNVSRDDFGSNVSDERGAEHRDDASMEGSEKLDLPTPSVSDEVDLSPNVSPDGSGPNVSDERGAEHRDDASMEGADEPDRPTPSTSGATGEPASASNDRTEGDSHPLPPSPHGGRVEGHADRSEAEEGTSSDRELPSWVLVVAGISFVGFAATLGFFYTSAFQGGPVDEIRQFLGAGHANDDAPSHSDAGPDASSDMARK